MEATRVLAWVRADGKIRHGGALLGALLSLASCHDKVHRPKAPETASPAPVDASLPIASAPSADAASEPPPEAPPQEPPKREALAAEIDSAVLGAMARKEVPGAVVCVVSADSVLFERAYGIQSSDEKGAQPLPVDALFDLASLTKVVATAPSIHLLAQEGKLRLSDPVARYWTAFGQNGKDHVTIEQLLLHTSGLPADNSLSDYRGGLETALRRIEQLKLEAPPGARFVYSDVGFISLGELVRRLSGMPLDAFAKQRIFGPLEMPDTSFRPGPELLPRAVPTERREGKILRGEVHDERAGFLGGVAGHAGLFSTARDLARFAQMLLREGSLGSTTLLSKPSFQQMTAPHTLPKGAVRSLGWDIQTGYSGLRGELRGGFGHTGWTGTSLWVDPSLDVAVVILSSRLYPDGHGDARRLRKEVANAVAHERAREAAVLQTPRVKVLTGLDVLERDGLRALKGARVGLVSSDAARDRNGHSAAKAFSESPALTLVSIFSPEHGLSAQSDGLVSDGRDPTTGVPVHSLYGKHRRPQDQELQGLDTLVFDLQDAGARFYTFATTLGYVLEAAAAHGLRVVVLDRPNPVGGLAVEGPVLEDDLASFIGYHRLPIRHGMTMGELGLLFNQERKIGARLEVIPMEGWRRELWFDATDLPWVNPSPNLRSVDEAALYPGIALVEATNVSVGRGTDRPFELVGAPWIDGERLASALRGEALSGVQVQATSFTPHTAPFAGQTCGGVEFRIVSRAELRPVHLGLAIARSLARLYRSEWQPRPMLPALGRRATFDALVRGEPQDHLEEGWRPELTAFLATRKRYLLY